MPSERERQAKTALAPQLLFDYEQAASALSLTRAALRDLVHKGRGPVVTKIGRRALFAIVDLEASIEQHRQAPQLRTAHARGNPTPLQARPSIIG